MYTHEKFIVIKIILIGAALKALRSVFVQILQRVCVVSVKRLACEIITACSNKTSVGRESFNGQFNRIRTHDAHGVRAFTPVLVRAHMCACSTVLRFRPKAQYTHPTVVESHRPVVTTVILERARATTLNAYV